MMRHSFSLLGPLLIGVASFLAVHSAGASPLSQDACTPASVIMKKITDVRGKKFLRPVPCFVRSRKEIGKMVAAAIARDLSPEQLRYEGAVLRAFGFVPPEYDYERGLLSLYQAQLGGLYEPVSREFVMADWLPQEMVPGVLAHELTHALQDQHYHLRQFVDFGGMNGDELLARMSLAEGEATLVGIDVGRSEGGKPPLHVSGKVPEIAAIEASLAALPYGTEHPPALQYFLSFPYTYGVLFTHHLIERGGYEEVSIAFDDPPVTSAEVLHPELWRRGLVEWAPPGEADVFPRGAPQTILHADQIGEFGIRVLLRVHTANDERAGAAAKGWNGDRVFLYHDRAGKLRATWFLWWKRESDLREFSSAVREAFLRANISPVIESGRRRGRFPYWMRIEASPER